MTEAKSIKITQGHPERSPNRESLSTTTPDRIKEKSKLGKRRPQAAQEL